MQNSPVPNNNPNSGFTFTAGTFHIDEHAGPVSQKKKFNALSPKIKFLKCNSLYGIHY
jgi:hypothetical protein